MYLVVAVEATSLAMRWLPRKVWRTIHLFSFVLFTTSTVHAIQTGTDTANPLVRGIGIALLATATIALVLRVADARRKAAGRTGLGGPTGVDGPTGAGPAPAGLPEPILVPSFPELIDWVPRAPEPISADAASGDHWAGLQWPPGPRTPKVARFAEPPPMISRPSRF